MRCDLPSPKRKTDKSSVPAYDELKSVHQLPRQPCHYIFALASPDACVTYHATESGKGGTGGASGDAALLPVPPLDATEPENRIFSPGQTAERPTRSAAEVMAKRRAAEDVHRASMDEDRKQRMLEMQMQRQLEQMQKQKEERLRKRAKEAEEDQKRASQDDAAAAQHAVAGGSAKPLPGGKDGGKDRPIGDTHGRLSGFGSPAATPEGDVNVSPPQPAAADRDEL